MKNARKIIVGVATMLILTASCKKDKNTADYTTIDSEKSQTKTELNRTQSYNDTLKTVLDTVTIKKNNAYCLKYDKLYHQNDSLFNMHYMMFGNEMYKNGMMMSNYSPSNSMMQGGGMMNSNNSMMDKDRMMSDTATMGGYYRDMQKLHTQHQSLHNAIIY